MRLFLVDFENTHSDGLEGVEFLKKQDKITIFYGKSCTMKFDAVENLCKSNAEVEYINNTFISKNSLDFQLVFYMGMKAGKFQGKKLDIYIISKDSGYDSLCKCKEYIDMKGIEISRSTCIGDAIGVLPEVAEDASAVRTLQDVYNDIEVTLKNRMCTEDEIKDVIRETKMSFWDPNVVHNHLQKKWGRRGSVLYSYAKKYIRENVKMKTKHV